MTVTTGPSEVWQARIDAELAAALREDSTVLGLKGRTEIVRAALVLLHQRAAEERMARSVEDFHQGRVAPLPIGVRPAAGRTSSTDCGAGPSASTGATDPAADPAAAVPDPGPVAAP